jgi:hypothetical protein
MGYRKMSEEEASMQLLRKGFMQGFSAALKIFSNKVGEINIEDICEAFLSTQSLKDVSKPKWNPLPPRKGGIPGKTLECIRTHDGIRGYEIVADLDADEQLVRIALNRLQKKRFIEKRGDMWHSCATGHDPRMK